MKVCGIIAEYNPFHKGHLYHLQTAKELTGADYTIGVMSGNFMQRGTPALADKHIRTKAALSCGADLVLELPVYYACGSAEYFASGAVSLLDKLGIVTYLCFGSESGDLFPLQNISRILAEEPADFRMQLREHLKSGLSFPGARAAALQDACPQAEDVSLLLSSPNNILGIEYMKALYKRNSPIQPLTISRKGAAYHDTDLTGQFSSATAIRSALEQGAHMQDLADRLPHQSYTVYADYFTGYSPLYADDFSAILHYKLLSEQQEGYASYLDVSNDLSDRILKNLYLFTSFTGFCDLLKTKELTYSRISRCLLHILLNIKKSDINVYVNELDYTPYARILGFQRHAVPLLNEISKHTCIPLISKLADAEKNIGDAPLDMLKKNIIADQIYYSVLAGKNHASMKNEYSTPIVIL